jgi:hypothetical protein
MDAPQHQPIGRCYAEISLLFRVVKRFTHSLWAYFTNAQPVQCHGRATNLVPQKRFTNNFESDHSTIDAPWFA